MPLPSINLSGTTLANYNAYLPLVRANSAGCDFIVDEAADPTIGPLSAASNATYYIDGTHLTDLGAEIEATLMAGVVSQQFIH